MDLRTAQQIKQGDTVIHNNEHKIVTDTWGGPEKENLYFGFDGADREHSVHYIHCELPFTPLTLYQARAIRVGDELKYASLGGATLNKVLAISIDDDGAPSFELFPGAWYSYTVCAPVVVPYQHGDRVLHRGKVKTIEVVRSVDSPSGSFLYLGFVGDTSYLAEASTVERLPSKEARIEEFTRAMVEEARLFAAADWKARGKCDHCGQDLPITGTPGYQPWSDARKKAAALAAWLVADEVLTIEEVLKLDGGQGYNELKRAAEYASKTREQAALVGLNS